MGNAVEYLDVASPLHKLNPLTKLLGLLCIFLMGVIFSDPFILMLLVGLILLLFLLAKAGGTFLKYLRVMLAAGAVMLLLQLLFSHDGPALYRFIPAGIPVLSWMGTINRDSLVLGIVMVVRMSVFGLSLPLLLATTQPRDLVLVMVERLKFPYQYALMFITALRFIPTLFVEIENIFQAQQARAFELTTRNPLKRVKAYFPLVVPLVLIALRKAEQLALAMETRGYGMGKRTYLRRPVFGAADFGACAGCISLVLLAVTLRVYGVAV